MNLAAALRDARHTERVQRAQAAVVAKYAREHRDGKRIVTRSWWRGSFAAMSLILVPLLVPLFAWLGQEHDVRFLRFAAFMAVLFGAGHILQFSLLYFPANDVLRHRSRAGVLILRLRFLLPFLLPTGLCWFGGLAIVAWHEMAAHVAGAAALFLAVLWAPVLWTLGRIRSRLEPDSDSTLGPMVAVAACWGLVWYIVTDAERAWHDIVLGVLVGILGTFAVIATLKPWITEPLVRLRALGTDLAIVPRWAVAIAFLVPSGEIDFALLLGPVAWGILAFVAIWTVVMLVRVVEAVHDAEELPAATMIVREDEPRPERLNQAFEVQLPMRHAGRGSPMRAALYLHRRTSSFRPGECASAARMLNNLPSMFFSALHHVWGVLLSVLAVAMTTETTVHTTLALLAGLMAPTFVVQAPNARMHLLGVDYRAQAWHNLRAILFFAVVPVLFAAAVTGTLAGWNTPRIVVVSCIVVSFALRIGWRGFTGIGELGSMSNGLILALLALLVGSVFLPATPGPWVFAGLGIAAGVGAIGVGLRIRGFKEARLAAAVRTHEHGDL